MTTLSFFFPIHIRMLNGLKGRWKGHGFRALVYNGSLERGSVLPCLYRPLQAEIPGCFKAEREQLIHVTRNLITSTLSPHINVV